MARRFEGVITALELGEAGRSDVAIKRIAVRNERGNEKRLSSTSMRPGTFALLRQGEAATLYVGGPFFWILPSQIFGARSAAGAFFHAPKAIYWVPGGALVAMLALPLALLPITLLLFPILVLAGIWMMLLSWDGMGARAMFKRDQKRAAKEQAR